MQKLTITARDWNEFRAFSFLGSVCFVLFWATVSPHSALANSELANSELANSEIAKPELVESKTEPNASSANDRPNIVVIMADDMGFGDVQYLNPESKIPTPNLNKLAKSGLSFSDAHTPSAVCTPTRYGLITGRYCWRSRLKRGVLNGYSPALIEKDRPTIATVLKQKEYHCGIVGKWHLGLGFQTADGKKGQANFDYSKKLTHSPNDLGFDYSYVIPASLDFPPYLYLENGQATMVPELDQPAVKFPSFLRKGPRAADLDMESCLLDLGKKASEFVATSAKSDTPYFLYFPLTAPHKPVLPHPDFRKKTELGDYGDFVHQVDHVVGMVLKAIEESGESKNTLVIYTSDNGSFMKRSDKADEIDHVTDATKQLYSSSNHTANGPFRGTKADIWEAGHHVPFFVRWPDSIKANSKSNTTICLTDIMATVASITGAKMPTDSAEDSISFQGEFSGKKIQRPPVIHHSASGMFAIRNGQWKLVLGNGSGGREAPRGKPFSKPYWLSNMKTNIDESKNFAKENSEMVKKLEADFQKIFDNGSRDFFNK